MSSTDGKVPLLVPWISRKVADKDRIKQAGNDAGVKGRAMNSVTLDAKGTILKRDSTFAHVIKVKYNRKVKKQTPGNLEKTLFQISGQASFKILGLSSYFYNSFCEKDICSTAGCLVFRLISPYPFRNSESDLLLTLTLFVDSYKYDCYVVIFVFKFSTDKFTVCWDTVKPF